MKYIDYTWEQERNKRYCFPVVAENDVVHMSYIHPLQQVSVNKINNALRNDDRVCAVVLFGSSINLRCNIHSDLDLVIRLDERYVNRETKNEISEIVQECCNWNADILWYDMLQPNERVYKEVLKGVQIV